MKIGIIISSLTKNIPYLTYLVSMGYEVFPILLDKSIDIDSNKSAKGVIEAIANRNIIYSNNLNTECKFDCLIILVNYDELLFISNIDFTDIIKDEVPIIISCEKHLENNSFSIFTYPNLQIVPENSFDVVNNCNEIQKHLKKIV